MKPTLASGSTVSSATPFPTLVKANGIQNFFSNLNTFPFFLELLTIFLHLDFCVTAYKVLILFNLCTHFMSRK